MLPELQEKYVSQIFNTYLAVRKVPGNSVFVFKVHQKMFLVPHKASSLASLH